jgi:hypothetical protein
MSTQDYQVRRRADPAYRKRQSEWHRAWYRRKRNEEKFRAYKREWARKHRKTDSDKRNELYRTNPLVRMKEAARGAIYRALRDGKMKKPRRCQECNKIPPKRSDGLSGLQAHHPDYSLKLDVIWLCCECHGKLDRTL